VRIAGAHVGHAAPQFSPYRLCQGKPIVLRYGNGPTFWRLPYALMPVMDVGKVRMRLSNRARTARDTSAATHRPN